MSWLSASQILNDAYDSSGQRIKVDLGTDSVVIGSVAIDQTTDGTTNKVQARNATHDNFNANANIQVGNADAAVGNPVPISGSVSSAITAAINSLVDGSLVTLGAKADDKSAATDTTAITAMSILKEISYMLQNPASRAVTNAGTFATQAAVTAALNAVVDGAIVTLGAKADAKSDATDTTAITVMQVLKQLSYMEQNPASRAVTNAGTFAVQATDASLPTTPAIYNVELTTADTEYSQALPAGTKKFSVSVQSGDGTGTFRFAFATGKVATPTAPYGIRKDDAEYYEDGVNLTGATLYLAHSAGSVTAQIIAWS
jgi:hypothetical protein